MELSRRMFRQLLCVFLTLLFVTSLGCAQDLGSWTGKKRFVKTIQLFAEDDDPTAWISVNDGETFQKREVVFNPVFLNRIDTIRRGDKLVGYLFDDVYLKATVFRARDGYQAEIRADIDGDGGMLEIFVMRGKITLRIYFHNAEKSYICDFDKNEGHHVIKEIESGLGRRRRIERTVAAARAAGPKTVQIFAEDDDPTNRFPWNENDDSFQAYVRRRKTSINPQLLGNRMHEILVGDTLVGNLFENEYFKGVVISRSEGDFSRTLELKVVGDVDSRNQASVIIGGDRIFLTFRDKKRGRMFRVKSTGSDPSQVVVEIDESKMIFMEGGAPLPSEIKKDK